MSIESVLADTIRISGILLRAGFKLAEATASAVEISAEAISAWAERARVKNDIATVEEWNKITPPTKEDILATKAKMRASKEAGEDLASKN